MAAASNDTSMQETVQSIAGLDLTALYALWRARDADQWRHSIALYTSVAKKLLRGGEALLAFDVLREALSVWPEDLDLKTLQGLALARCGASERANDLLQEIYDAGHRDEETVSILARTHKDLWLSAAQPEIRRRHLESAEALYSEAFAGDRTVRYWSGINAATLALYLDKNDVARSLALQVRQICQRIVDAQTAAGSASGIATAPAAGATAATATATATAAATATATATAAEKYWLYATLGEAALILGDLIAAASGYHSAAAQARGSHGDIATTRRNARLILEAQNYGAEMLDEFLPAPTVVVFSGHMIDAPGSGRLRFPLESEPKVARAIKDYLLRTGAQIGFSSAACGADILFLEAMLEIGGEINIVLPSNTGSFIEESVDRDRDGRWIERFEKVMRRAKQVIYASEHSVGEVYLAYANILMFGLAKSWARQVDGRINALSVWDGVEGKAGGTASAIALWRDCGQAVTAVHPLTLQLQELPPNLGALTPSDTWLASGQQIASDESRKLVSMLFADAVGFSKLEEKQIPKFVTHFLGPVAELIDRAKIPPIVRNTWGDALYFVFNDVTSAGTLALDICDLVRATNWTEVGLPEHMGIRIGLHSGPAYPMVDPVLKQFSYTGVHVSRAARIEPITPAGAVYASQAFAALAEAVGVKTFACDYVGRTSLAKHYGEYPTYRVRRV